MTAMRNWVVLVVLLAMPAMASAASPSLLEGNWISEAYIDALERTHSPLEATSVAAPEVFTIARSGSRWKLTRTNYHEATWHIVKSFDQVDGDLYRLTVGAAETTAAEDPPVTFDIALDPDGKHATGPLWSDSPTRFRHVDEDPLVVIARLLLVGEYLDAKQRPWSFKANGFARSPVLGSFRFEPVLDTMEACCDYLLMKKRTEEDVRIGFKWEDGRLNLYHMLSTDEGCPISCEAKPFAVLTPAVARAH